jgi:hypothetical protein
LFGVENRRAVIEKRHDVGIIHLDEELRVGGLDSVKEQNGQKRVF